MFLVLDCVADLQSIVADLLSDQYRHPLRVVAFSTEAGWIRDVTAEIAREVLSRAVQLDHGLPAAVRDSWSGRVAESLAYQSPAPEPWPHGFLAMICSRYA